jgi:Resolvase, N terminal domain
MLMHNDECMNTTRTAVSSPLIAYIRVSTQQQGKSGLGIEAQRAAIARFAETEGLDLIGEHVENREGGRRTGPPAGLARSAGGGQAGEGGRGGGEA